ncbi:uncharacterized protein C8Q71DRAFT_544738 [Rhodofomes roseus]|uniref:Uncharacterized protein n=1 Tax=Rhodofomes roseus TaxID=34475 RepID=A0ABQ8KLH7_9APHY|nr:uncharacterized protein C8Q71DRAFT_544738 [Rhodofomes roseus]KAH9838743.1 hypothetical protein C8Q71DRAFT_544738 [Rhodofomes roseus]
MRQTSSITSPTMIRQQRSQKINRPALRAHWSRAARDRDSICESGGILTTWGLVALRPTRCRQRNGHTLADIEVSSQSHWKLGQLVTEHGSPGPCARAVQDGPSLCLPTSRLWLGFRASLQNLNGIGAVYAAYAHGPSPVLCRGHAGNSFRSTTTPARATSSRIRCSTLRGVYHRVGRSSLVGVQYVVIQGSSLAVDHINAIPFCTAVQGVIASLTLTAGEPQDRAQTSSRRSVCCRNLSTASLPDPLPGWHVAGAWAHQLALGW